MLATFSVQIAGRIKFHESLSTLSIPQASFAQIAYASAYLKFYYLAAFTCALLNNQPMGFYSPATLVKDAQLHGLRVRPIDVQRSEWLCTLETELDSTPWLRVGLNYAKGLRRQAAEGVSG